MKILIIQTAFLGDLILTTGFIRRVKELFPHSEISIIVNSGTESILYENPYLSEIIPFNKKEVKKNLFKFFKFLNQIKSKHFEVCFSPHFSHRSSIIAFWSGAKKRVGYREAGFSFLLTQKKHRPLKGLHEVQKLFLLLNEESSPYKPEIYFSNKEVSQIQEIMLASKLNFMPNSNYITIAPSSIWETKRMPEFKFREILSLILEHTPYIPVLVGSKADIPISNQVKLGFETAVVDLTGKTNLKEFCYVISNSKALISNDSSPIHVASAFDVPTIAIFGATIPAFGYTPLSSKQFISEINGLKCRPCGIHGGRFCPERHFSCMLQQDTKLIFEKLIQLINS